MQSEIENLKARINRLEEINTMMRHTLGLAWSSLDDAVRFESACARKSPGKCLEAVIATINACNAAQTWEDAQHKVFSTI